MLIGGDEKIGKSHLIDCLLEQFAEQGLRVHLYINEMSRRQRVNRMITRATGIPTRALKARNLTEKQLKSATEAINHLRVGITECQGWTAPEITRHIRRHKWDVCAVDIAHNITKTEQRQCRSMG
jgi:replicative DNA helicase